MRWFIGSAQNRLRRAWKKNKTAHFQPKQQIMFMTDHIRSHQTAISQGWMLLSDATVVNRFFEIWYD